MKGAQDYRYLESEKPGPDILAILGTVPRRWGRMDKASRLAVVEVGRALLAAGLIDKGRSTFGAQGMVGLVGGTRRGSLATDLAYAETLALGVEMASPMYFSYTLANIALAEAASHYGLNGPVYSVYSGKPYEEAISEARRWLACEPSLSAMLAGELDFIPEGVDGGPLVAASFELVKVQGNIL